MIINNHAPAYNKQFLVSQNLLSNTQLNQSIIDVKGVEIGKNATVSVGAGSGVIIRSVKQPDGSYENLILTNQHVIGLTHVNKKNSLEIKKPQAQTDAKKVPIVYSIPVFLSNGKKIIISNNDIIFSNTKKGEPDLSLLRFRSKEPQPFVTISTERATVGAKALQFGFPGQINTNPTTKPYNFPQTNHMPQARKLVVIQTTLAEDLLPSSLPSENRTEFAMKLRDNGPGLVTGMSGGPVLTYNEETKNFVVMGLNAQAGAIDKNHPLFRMLEAMVKKQTGNHVDLSSICIANREASKPCIKQGEFDNLIIPSSTLNKFVENALKGWKNSNNPK